jgi:anaerobic ribonucleoside-triphosphate reductase
MELLKTIENCQRTRCEVWSRAMGYMRPTSNFNPGKKSEFNDRKYFKESVAAAKEFCVCEKMAA